MWKRDIGNILNVCLKGYSILKSGAMILFFLIYLTNGNFSFYKSESKQNLIIQVTSKIYVLLVFLRVGVLCFLHTVSHCMVLAYFKIYFFRL